MNGNELDVLIEKELALYGITIENVEENADRVQIEIASPPTSIADDAIIFERYDFYIDGAYVFSVEYRVMWDNMVSKGIYVIKTDIQIVKKGE